jgi:hypothetical protein
MYRGSSFIAIAPESKDLKDSGVMQSYSDIIPFPWSYIFS